MRVDLRVTYELEPDRFFWLREPPDGTAAAEATRRIIDAIRNR